jgi:hypothetical protein
VHLGALSYADLMHQNHHLEVVKLVSASSSKKRLKHMQSRSLQQLNGGVCQQAHMAFNERCSGSPQTKKREEYGTIEHCKNQLIALCFQGSARSSYCKKMGFGEICSSV